MILSTDTPETSRRAALSAAANQVVGAGVKIAECSRRHAAMLDVGEIAEARAAPSTRLLTFGHAIACGAGSGGAALEFLLEACCCFEE